MDLAWDGISIVFTVKHLESKCLDSRNKTVAGPPLYEQRMICFPPGGPPSLIVGKKSFWLWEPETPRFSDGIWKLFLQCFLKAIAIFCAKDNVLFSADPFHKGTRHWQTWAADWWGQKIVYRWPESTFSTLPPSLPQTTGQLLWTNQIAFYSHENLIIVTINTVIIITISITIISSPALEQLFLCKQILKLNLVCLATWGSQLEFQSRALIHILTKWKTSDSGVCSQYFKIFSHVKCTPQGFIWPLLSLFR